MNVLLSGKVAMVCGLLMWAKALLNPSLTRKPASSFPKSTRMRIACMYGYEVTTVEDALPVADIFVTPPATRTL